MSIYLRKTNCTYSFIIAFCFFVFIKPSHAQTPGFEGMLKMTIHETGRHKKDEVLKIYFHNGKICVDSIHSEGVTMRVITNLKDGNTDMIYFGTGIPAGVSFSIKELATLIDSELAKDSSEFGGATIRIEKTGKTKTINGYPCYEAIVYGKDEGDTKDEVGLTLWMTDSPDLKLTELRSLFEVLKNNIPEIGTIAGDVKEVPPSFWSAFPIEIDIPEDSKNNVGKGDRVTFAIIKNISAPDKFDETGIIVVNYKDVETPH